MWKHFKIEEFNCPDCGLNTMDHALIDVLDDVHDEVNFTMYINSGTRCEAHNTAVGGKPNSAHLTGPDGHSHAADVAIQNDHQRFLLFRALMKHGVVRLEDAPTWVHADNASYLPQEVVFRG